MCEWVHRLFHPQQQDEIRGDENIAQDVSTALEQVQKESEQPLAGQEFIKHWYNEERKKSDR